MNNIFKWLKRPYPSPNSWKSDLGYALGLSIFIFLFLRLFQPFGLHHQFPNKNWVIGGFGLVTLLAYAIVRFMLPLVFQKWFHPDRWTTGKQLLAGFANILLIGFGNFAYMAFLGYSTFSVLAALAFLLYTMLIAVFPMTIMIIGTEMRLLKLHHAASMEVNQILAEPTPRNTKLSPLTITNEDGKIELKVLPSEILFCSAADNYVEIHFLRTSQPEKVLLRSSLKRIEEQLQTQSHMVRCHRSYLVNLDQIAQANGNSAGLRLQINHVPHILPVSRAYVSQLKQSIQPKK